MARSPHALRNSLTLCTAIAVVVALPVMLMPAIVVCWLLALWRRTRTRFLVGAAVIALPASVVVTLGYPPPRSLARPGDAAPAEVHEKYRMDSDERWREYEPQDRIRAIWVLAAMLAAGVVVSNREV